MKTPQEILAAIGRRVAAHWHTDIAGPSPSWPHSFALGGIPRRTLEADFAAVQQQTFAWRDWAAQRDLILTTTSRRVQGTTQAIPTHLAIPDLNTALSLLGTDWTERVRVGRNRLAVLGEKFPDVPDLPAVVRAADGYSDTDFGLLCTAAAWFRVNSASGLTPRQVPIEGLHAKWLNTHRPLVMALARLDTLGLVTSHPQRVHFTYLDPDHLAAGRRRHDSVTTGDTMTPHYAPAVVVISENKDTAVHFPPLPCAIAIEGAGFAGAPGIAAIPWIAQAGRVVYWGDMDAAGLEIVNSYRGCGLTVDTILMDLPSYEVYERFGAITDARGESLAVPVRKALPHLTPAEGALYERLTDPQWPRARRIEQERIPLAIAAALVLTPGR
ncbi:Wadjet anti-phage system protein JetD domain-containing protein [Streptosporangium canum]|uniref:Wadjet anti-phage system protein JetD domain-containing protein n=1 Tax=Streptosporangium canum TaxID=324952 RepID=UPI00378DD40A